MSYAYNWNTFKEVIYLNVEKEDLILMLYLLEKEIFTSKDENRKKALQLIYAKYKNLVDA